MDHGAVWYGVGGCLLTTVVLSAVRPYRAWLHEVPTVEIQAELSRRASGAEGAEGPEGVGGSWRRIPSWEEYDGASAGAWRDVASVILWWLVGLVWVLRRVLWAGWSGLRLVWGGVRWGWKGGERAARGFRGGHSRRIRR